MSVPSVKKISLAKLSMTAMVLAIAIISYHVLFNKAELREAIVVVAVGLSLTILSFVFCAEEK